MTLLHIRMANIKKSTEGTVQQKVYILLVEFLQVHKHSENVAVSTKA